MLKKLIFNKYDNDIFNIVIYFKKIGKKYDLDASTGYRPIEVTSLRGTVTVEVLANSNATSSMPVNNSWIELSTSSNYTDAINRKNSGDQDALTTKLTFRTDIPALTKLYLYHDENLNYTTRNPFSADMDKITDRRLYIRFTFSSTNQPPESHVCYMNQRCAFYMGQIGGDQDPYTGIYDKGLVIGNNFNLVTDEFLSYHKFTPTGTAQYKTLLVGYFIGIFDYYLYANEFGVDNRVNGKQATKLYSENKNRYSTMRAGDVTIPAPSWQNGKLDLYQYQGKYNSSNSFAARWCYDKNRDKNGNGVIDYLPNDPTNNELIWYLPAINQFRYFGLNYYGTKYNTDVSPMFTYHLLSTSFDGLDSPYVPALYTPVGSNTSYEVRCVRDVELPVNIKYQNEPVFTNVKVEIVDNYAVINTTGLVSGVSVDKTIANNIYIDKDGRNIRHYDYSKVRLSISSVVSARFRVAPRNIKKNGEEISVLNGTMADATSMTWAEAAGFNTATNTLDVGVAGVYPEETGCAVYKGRSSDANLGKWRLPTVNEMVLIEMLDRQLELTKSSTGYEILTFNSSFPGTQVTGGSTYWTSSEYLNSTSPGSNGKQACVIQENYSTSVNIYNNRYVNTGNKGITDGYYVRCVQDIPK